MSRRPTTARFAVEGPRWANLNGPRGNHHAHQALMNAWKALALAAIHEANLKPVDAPVTITAVVRRTTNARADAHNVTPTIKACIDAVVSAGLIEDDHDGIVARLIIQGGPKAARPTVEIEVNAA